MPKRGSRATTSEVMTSEKARVLVEGRSLHHEQPFQFDNREHWNLLDHPICTYAEGGKDNNLIPYGEIERTLHCKGSVNVKPSSHSGDIRPPQAHILYQLIKQSPVRVQDVIFASIKEVAIHGRKGAGMMFPHFISDLYIKANVRDSGQDSVFSPLGFMNYDQLEFAEPVPEGGTQHRKTSKAFQFLYRNQQEIAKAGHITHGIVTPPYLTKSFPTASADVPGSSQRGKEKMVAPDFEDDDDEMEDGDSEEF
ncbi:uncharacterized protein G2W53_041208 [Senna tora]|uniref:Uncharacterized protein n=1 Tax=Senna tora TaxID=362788 RepID=A0A834SJK5_9FABA|nr:uncharacterized protein G2W53_041208 [Senna tora]